MVLDGVPVAFAIVAPEAAQAAASPRCGAPCEAFGHPEHLEDRSLDPKVALDVGVAELHQVRRGEKSQRRGTCYPDLDLGLAGEIEGLSVPQLQAQRNRHGLPELLDQAFDAAF